MKKIITFLYLLILAYACYDDKGNYDYREINQISIQNIDNLEGNTTGSFSVSSKLGTKSTVFLLISASISMEIIQNLSLPLLTVRLRNYPHAR